ncbi:hypothetical protein SDC9_190057 [bioreactor metagenome]|uniref:Uncharacterized protein n=1 Tax=bioreactor metagenome TaxID=1076179 RepID=A0A645HUG0_9ZZZZ
MVRDDPVRLIKKRKIGGQASRPHIIFEIVLKGELFADFRLAPRDNPCERGNLCRVDRAVVLQKHRYGHADFGARRGFQVAAHGLVPDEQRV